MMAIEKGNIEAMYNLGYYYKEIEKNYGEMKKYYMMAIEKGYDSAMNNLGYYYENIEKNYEEMKKYYIMAIEKGNINAMNNLGSYYKKFIKNIYKITTYNNIIITVNKKECLICKNINRFTIHTNCKYNNVDLEHYYCIDCFKKWYNTNEFKCLICKQYFNDSNFILNILNI
jgi:TPR repeat protein